jgi:hypothetical protein
MNSLNIFNNAFAHKHKKNGFHRPNYSKLEILGLEQRITPTATSGSSYSIILEPNDIVTGARGYDASTVLLSGSYVNNNGVDNGLWWKGSLETGAGTTYQVSPVVPGQTITSSVYYGPNTNLFDPTLGEGNIRIVGIYKNSLSTASHGVMYTGPLSGTTNSVNWTGNLDVPSLVAGGTVLNTIPHSTMGNFVVGNYDLVSSPTTTVNAFIYNISANSWTVLDIGSKISDTTVYGIWQNGIGSTSYTLAGGSNNMGQPNAFLMDFDSTTGAFSNLTFFPDNTSTNPIKASHFEGITGRNGGYNLVATTSNGPAFVTVTRLSNGTFGTATFTSIDISGSTISTGNTVYQNYAMGIFSNGGSIVNSYVTQVPGPIASSPLVTGTPALASSGGSSTVTLYDPVTGQPTGTAVPFPGFTGAIHVASGDFNNDGVADIFAAAGEGGGPAIAILNSQTGEVLESFFAFDPAFTGGVFIAVQDFNGDGILDIIAGAGTGGGPEVRIFDGSNLRVLKSFYAYAEDFTGGVRVATLDFNNDGILDLVTGAGPGGAAHVKVFDGATNAILSQWFAYPITFTGGVFVAVGDIGNDGTIEVVTGAGAGGAPVVAVWNPYTATLLSEFYAYAEDFTGGVRVGVSDGNGDGILDIITGAGKGGGPQVNGFSFPDLDLLFSFYSGDPANTGGVYVS